MDKKKVLRVNESRYHLTLLTHHQPWPDSFSLISSMTPETRRRTNRYLNTYSLVLSSLSLQVPFLFLFFCIFHYLIFFFHCSGIRRPSLSSPRPERTLLPASGCAFDGWFNNDTTLHHDLSSTHQSRWRLMTNNDDVIKLCCVSESAPSAWMIGSPLPLPLL